MMRAILLVLAAIAAPASGSAAPTAKAAGASTLGEIEVAAIRQECETLAARYSQYLDNKDWQSLPGVFAEDGVWDILSNHLVGHAAIRDYWKSRTADWSPTHGRVHHVANHVVDVVDRDHARGTSMVIVYFFDTKRGGNTSLAPQLIARNRDEYVRTAAGWRIKHRAVELVADLAH